MISVHDIIAQGAGLAGFGIIFYGLNHTNDRHMKLYVCAAALLFAVQYAFLGAMTGAALFVLAAVRYALSAVTKNRMVMSLFLGIYFSMAYYSLDRPIDLFLLAGNIIGTIAIFRLEKRRMRYAFLAGGTCNLVYHIHFMAIGSILSEITTLLIHLNVIRKLRKERA